MKKNIEGLDGINLQNVNDILKNKTGNDVTYIDNNKTINVIVVSTNNDSKVTKVSPNIALGDDGYPILDNNGKTYLAKNKLYSGDLMVDPYSKKITYKCNFVKVTKVNESNVVIKCNPNVKLDSIGYAIKDSNSSIVCNKPDKNEVLINPNYSRIGDNLRDEYSNIIFDSKGGNIKVTNINTEGIHVNGNYLVDTNNYPIYDSTGNKVYSDEIDKIGIVTKCIPDIQLDSNGYAKKSANNKLIYNPGMYVLNENGEIVLDQNGNKIINTQYNSNNPSPSASTSASTNDITRYDNNPDVFPQYHDTEDQIKAASDYSEFKNGEIYVRDKNGNVVILPNRNVQGSTLYFQPGYFQFGSSNFVPNYEDSVYLSKTTGLSSSSTINPSYNLGGICNQYKDQPLLLEEACQKLNGNVCASTSCCVLLGGSKCVSGDERGPSVKSNYSDIFVPNRDYYYYQGKCYGNCQ
uniref:Uncharacterized protein n=1 Tax=viral metagenome TaxID=1070528 RepID=A0A6C0DBZ9_9ZZZZ